MTKQLKYRVKLPIYKEDGTIEYKEKDFAEKKDVCEFLEIDYAKFNRLKNQALKCTHKDTVRLHGIIIKKLEVKKVEKIDEKLQKEKTSEFVQKLLEKL